MNIILNTLCRSCTHARTHCNSWHRGGTRGKQALCHMLTGIVHPLSCKQANHFCACATSSRCHKQTDRFRQSKGHDYCCVPAYPIHIWMAMKSLTTLRVALASPRPACQHILGFVGCRPFSAAPAAGSAAEPATSSAPRRKYKSSFKRCAQLAFHQIL